jgi:hypothetical protein
VDRLSAADIQSDLSPILGCLDEVLKTDPENLKTLVYAGIVADRLDRTDQSKAYWQTVKRVAPPDSEEAQQAGERLEQLTPNRAPWVVSLAILAGVAVLGGYLLIRQRGQFKEIPNLYLAGKPITTQEMFFGRRDLFDFIQSRLRGASQAITIVLYGGRRTGKTSVLHQILNGQLGPKFIPVLIDFQVMAGVDTGGFFQMISQKTREAVMATNETDTGPEVQTALESIEGRFNQPDNNPFQTFDDFLAAVSAQIEEQCLIFLVDEYEILQRKIDAGDISEEIFVYLRPLMQNHENLAFIFAGSREFGRMENRQWAFMFNAAIPRKVSFLQHEEAVRLMTEPVKGFVRYTPAAIEKFMRITAGQPYFIQLVCQEIVEYLNEVRRKKVTPEIVERVSTEIIVSNTPYHLAYIWSDSSREEKCVLSAAASLIDTETATVTVDEIEAKLAEHSLDLPQSEIHKTLASLIERELIEGQPDTDAYRFRMDLTRFYLQSEHSIWSLLNELSDA